MDKKVYKALCKEVDGRTTKCFEVFNFMIDEFENQLQQHPQKQVLPFLFGLSPHYTFVRKELFLYAYSLALYLFLKFEHHN